MSYSESNNNYQELTEDEKKLVGLDEQERYDAMEKVLSDLDDDDLMQMFRDQNSWSGGFEFCDGWDMDEFITVMFESKKSSELIDLILEIANAISEYEGDDYTRAWWGYFDDYSLAIKDEDDIADEAREYYLCDLAVLIVDGRAHIDDIPTEIDDMLNLWEMEDDGDFEDDEE